MCLEKRKGCCIRESAYRASDSIKTGCIIALAIYVHGESFYLLDMDELVHVIFLIERVRDRHIFAV